MAGTVHAVLSAASSAALSCYRQASPSPFVSALTPAYVLHHSFAHAVLFGSYEAWKRPLLRLLGGRAADRVGAEEGGECEGGGGGNGEGRDVNYSHLLAVGAAGGLAGSAQHVVSHYAEMWIGITERPERRADAMSPSGGIFGGKGGGGNAARRWSPLLLPPPTLRSIILVFPVSAIGFMAFEYGKEMVT